MTWKVKIIFFVCVVIHHFLFVNKVEKTCLGVKNTFFQLYCHALMSIIDEPILKCMNTLRAQLVFPSQPNFCNLFEFLTLNPLMNFFSIFFPHQCNILFIYNKLLNTKTLIITCLMAMKKRQGSQEHYAFVFPWYKVGV